MSIRNIDYHNVRYTQETFYPYFSNGKMSVSETYVALANGFLDPASLASITIFEHNKHLYCIDTRRLTILKELQRKKKLDVLKGFNVQYVREGDKAFTEQYFNLVYERLPAMKSKGLDGSTIKLYRQSGYMCCFDSISGNFRDDLDEHIACDHLKMSFSEFKELNISQCNRCNQKLHINAIKPSNKSYYIFKKNCTCRNSEPLALYTIKKPWTEFTLREICDVFVFLNATAHNKYASLTNVMKSISSKELPHGQPRLDKSSLNNNCKTEEIKNDGLIKQFCLFLLRIFFIAILFWLIFIYFQIK